MRRFLVTACLLLALGAPAAADADTTTTQPEPAHPDPTQPAPAQRVPDPQPGAAAAETEEHPVGPEDLLEISVFEIPDLSRTVRVSAKGTISLPLLGEMRVDGLSSMQLESKLREELTKRYLQDPQVSVFVREYGSKKVSVIGAVGKPRVYEMLGPRTLLEVLSEAGGLTPQAGAELYVIRPGKEGAEGKRLTVSVDDLMINRNPALNLAIQPGDIISAPNDRPSYVYVDGAVKTPGRIEQLASRPITLLQAVAKAGGTTDRANLKGVQILRQKEGGTQTSIQANLKRIRQGKDPDPILQDGDVVVVQETFF
jgi:polysaccharide export outer membrane protein